MAGKQSFLSRWGQKFRREAAASGVTRGAIATGYMMHTYADADGTSITVSQATLARQQGVTTRTIRSDQANLQQTGWIRPLCRGSGPGNPNEFRLSIPEKDVTLSSGSSMARRKNADGSPEPQRNRGGSPLPTTMGNHGTRDKTTPEGVVSSVAKPKRLMRISDLSSPSDQATEEWTTPEGVVTTGSKPKRLVRVSDLPPMNAWERAEILAQLDMELAEDPEAIEPQVGGHPVGVPV